MLSSYPDDSDLWRIKAQLQLNLHKKIEEAEDALIESLRLDPDNKEALLLMGKLLIVHKKEVEAARKYLERILPSYPNDYRSLTNCGATYVEAKSFTKAMAYFEAALRAKKDENHASYGLAHCLFETGKYQMTFERCLTALTVNPWRKEDIDVRQQASGLMLHLAMKLGPLTDFKKVSDALHTRLGNLCENPNPRATDYPTSYPALFKEACSLMQQSDSKELSLDNAEVRAFERKETE